MNRTKDAIAAAFFELLTERPLSKITVKDIVDRCGINRNTFYYHFEGIPSLIEQTVKYMSDQIIQTHSKFGAGRKILCKRFSTKSRMALENRADSGLDPLITESHGGQSGMRAGTA